jgi:hypothetical protein
MVRVLIEQAERELADPHGHRVSLAAVGRLKKKLDSLQ